MTGDAVASACWRAAAEMEAAAVALSNYLDSRVSEVASPVRPRFRRLSTASASPRSPSHWKNGPDAIAERGRHKPGKCLQAMYPRAFFPVRLRAFAIVECCQVQI